VTDCLPDGSESVSGGASKISTSNSVGWCLVWYEEGSSYEDALRLADEIMITDFRIARGMPVFQFPSPTTKTIELYPRKSVFCLYVFICCLVFECNKCALCLSKP